MFEQLEKRPKQMYKDKKQERDFRGVTNGKHFK